MDALSEVLRVVELQSAFFYNAEFSSPWAYKSPASCKMKPFLDHGDSHVIVFHFLLDGKAVARTDDRRISVGPGDIVVLPHGDSHFLENGPASETVDGEGHLSAIMAQGLKLSRMGGGGPITRFICGYMMCDQRLSQVFLAGLPSVFKINIREDTSGQWLENSIKHAVIDLSETGAGAEAVLAKLCGTLFAETLRRYIAQLPEGQTGWLAGARDPEVGRALALMHREPAAPWTIADLAQKVGLSRSVLAERFRQFLGEPPVAYLTRWRLQLGSRMLGSTNYSVAQIAAEVGYDSEQAFNRAFKREFGNPPARYRNELRMAKGA